MPGLKASAAEAGAPDGFVDVVAQLQPIADGDDTPPHWDVTFATDDVEATAALASELGAEVLHGPVDAPWVRHAVIRDPQGATIGRASCRERVCQYVSISVVAVSLNYTLQLSFNVDR